MTEQQASTFIPSPPRPINRRVSLRSWAESPVQLWWKSALVVALVMTYVTVIQVRDYARRKHLLANGVPVTVIVQELNDRKVGTGSYQPMRDIEHYVKLVGTYPDGRPYEFRGMLPKAEGFAQLGGELELRVDPENPNRWVEVGKQRSLAQEFTAMLILMPLVVVLMGIAYWQRMKVLNVWRQGRVRDVVVVDTRQSSMAPRSRVCRYTLADGDDRRVFQTLFPMKHGTPQPGEVMQMIMLPERPGRGIIADFYAREMTV